MWSSRNLSVLPESPHPETTRTVTAGRAGLSCVVLIHTCVDLRNMVLSRTYASLALRSDQLLPLHHEPPSGLASWRPLPDPSWPCVLYGARWVLLLTFDLVFDEEELDSKPAALDRVAGPALDLW